MLSNFRRIGNDSSSAQMLSMAFTMTKLYVAARLNHIFANESDGDAARQRGRRNENGHLNTLHIRNSTHMSRSQLFVHSSANVQRMAALSHITRSIVQSLCVLVCVAVAPVIWHNAPRRSDVLRRIRVLTTKLTYATILYPVLSFDRRIS